MLRVCRVLPPRKNFGGASSTTTEAPARRALMAAHKAALPPPITSVSYFFSLSIVGCFICGVATEQDRTARLFRWAAPTFLSSGEALSENLSRKDRRSRG